jgi:hypothetical protein
MSEFENLVEPNSEVTTSVPECHDNGMWEGVWRASGGFWLVSPFPPHLKEWHSDVLSCHLGTTWKQLALLSLSPTEETMIVPVL